MESTWLPSSEEVWDAIRYLDPDCEPERDTEETSDGSDCEGAQKVMRVLGLAYVRQHLEATVRAWFR